MIEPQTHLDPKITYAWRLGRMFRFTLLSIPFSLILFSIFSALWSWQAALFVSSIYLIYGLTFALIWPTWEYRFFRYDVRENDILIQQGVLFRRLSSIPHHRIQHVDTHQGPIERMLGLASLQLYTASGVTADGVIPGLADADAQNLRDELSKRGGDDGV
jgi:membrane protein YdbS with pleckstrin-like domain